MANDQVTSVELDEYYVPGYISLKDVSGAEAVERAAGTSAVVPLATGYVLARALHNLPLMQTNVNNANADDRAVATALTGVIVRGERDRLAETAAPGLAGARAALETFYHAFNTRSVDLAQRIRADDPLVQLVSPSRAACAATQASPR